MGYIFLGYYINLLFKGKQKSLQLTVSGVFLLFALICIPGVITYLSGANFTGGDFLKCVVFLYFTINFLFTLLAIKEIKDTKQQSESQTDQPTKNVKDLKAEQLGNEQNVKQGFAVGEKVTENTAEVQAPKKVKDFSSTFQPVHYSESEKQKTAPVKKVSTPEALKIKAEPVKPEPTEKLDRLTAEDEANAPDNNMSAQEMAAMAEEEESQRKEQDQQRLKELVDKTLQQNPIVEDDREPEYEDITDVASQLGEGFEKEGESVTVEQEHTKVSSDYLNNDLFGSDLPQAKQETAQTTEQVEKSETVTSAQQVREPEAEEEEPDYHYQGEDDYPVAAENEVAQEQEQEQNKETTEQQQDEIHSNEWKTKNMLFEKVAEINRRHI